MTPRREKLKKVLAEIELTEEEEARLRRLSRSGSVEEGRDALADAYFDDDADDLSGDGNQ